MSNLDIEKLKYDVEKNLPYTEGSGPDPNEAIRDIVDYIENLQRYMEEKLDDTSKS